MRLKMTTKEMIIKSCVEPAVNVVRIELAEKFDVENDPYYKYQGLCDAACKMFEEKMNEFNDKFGYHIETHIIHGEQKHSPKIHSNKWYFEHTWCYIIFGGHKIYVDPTSSQFQSIYNDIPDYYISDKKPKWYYPDSNNPLFWSIFKKFHNEKITDFLQFIPWSMQYVIWAKISDFIHKLIYE